MVLDGVLNTTYERYRDAVLALQEFNKKSADDGGAAINASVSSAVTGIIIGLVAALALGAAIGIFLSRSISAALNVVINSLSSGSGVFLGRPLKEAMLRTPTRAKIW